MKTIDSIDGMPVKVLEFRDELGGLINKYSKENPSDTPDFILAEFLVGCLASFDLAVVCREKWYGRGKPLT